MMIIRNAPRGSYIPAALTKHCLNGDSYVPIADSYRICCGETPKIPYSVFRKDLTNQIDLGNVVLEGSRMYLARTLRYEGCAATQLADILRNNTIPAPVVPEEMVVGNISLHPEQLKAVQHALSHRLSLILGGAGSGKTTLIQAIASLHDDHSSQVLCAPTGKAARNLKDRTGYCARTVHSALGMHPNEDFLSPIIWEDISLVIVDEASMVTLEMLAGILSRVRRNCSVVLLGDYNQLLSVGSGNVLPDLLRLGIPCVRLEANHRQNTQAIGLLHNVVGFSALHSSSDLAFDNSFLMVELEESKVCDALATEAVRRYQAGESVQVLSPYNKVTELSVSRLNLVIQSRVNPPQEDVSEVKYRETVFRDGDRVIITKNDRERNCSNGDIGIFRILHSEDGLPMYCVELPDGRHPVWEYEEDLENIALAYALTVHKVQGSEADTVLMPITDSFSNMLYRNLLYTAISRGKKQVLLYGSMNALGGALQRPARVRRSQLVAKTHAALMKFAG